MEKHMTKKILCIDGGGIKGVFPASLIATLEESIDGKVSDYFDLIVGTSTGGIIALGLGMGFTGQQVLTFYEKYGSMVFKGSPLGFLRHFGISKYSNEGLRQALEETFGAKVLGESSKRLVIPSMNLETGEVYIYKTAHHERFQHDYKVKAVDVALSTSAAPTYFPTHMSATGVPLVDGGVWANNPVGMAVVEAIGVLGWSKDDLQVLSIGCTSESMSMKIGKKLPWLLYWAPNLVSVFMASQSSASLGTAQILAGFENVTRIDPIVAKGKFGLDVLEGIKSLKGLGHSEARKALPHLKHFFEQKATKFDPIYKVENSI